MATQIYVNLPVQDLPKSMSFFKALGFAFNADFTSEHGACLVIDENIHVMLLQNEFFKSLIDKPVADAKKANEVIVCFSRDTRQQVDELVAKAGQGGARIPGPAEDHGFMYSQGFEDADGHLWNIVSYEPKA